MCTDGVAIPMNCDGIPKYWSQTSQKCDSEICYWNN